MLDRNGYRRIGNRVDGIDQGCCRSLCFDTKKAARSNDTRAQQGPAKRIVGIV
jgi:hypothetical protein